MYKLVSFLSLAFFGFILWIIYLADTAQESIFFDLVRAIPYGDKLGHFFLFGILSIGANFTLRLKTIKIFSFHIYIGSTLVFLFALTEELTQYFFPNRTLDITDLSADIAGIITFAIITRLITDNR